MNHSRTNHFHPRVYEAHHTSAPVKGLNPTHRWLAADKTPGDRAAGDKAGGTQSDPSDPKSAAHSPGVYYVWRSRDNRKGRHAVAVDPEYKTKRGHEGPAPSNTWRESVRGLMKMLLRYPVWDVSYDVAIMFTLGSVIWVANGFFSFLPAAAPSSEFSGETTWASGITALVGATVFEIGSVLLMLEAINENRSDCFGWAVEESVDGFLKLNPDATCGHHHASRKSFVKQSSVKSRDDAETMREAGHHQKPRKWSWWPTWEELTTHYIYELGFLASSSQLLGATVFWISGFTALPPILNALSLPAQNVLYWLPQVVGGVGFTVSSTFFMVEVQPKWYIPAPGVLGWHVGLWNLVGSVGFTLCGALGFDSANTAVNYALALSTFIGSWAFLLGSAVQWYESLDKYPMWVDHFAKQLAERT